MKKKIYTRPVCTVITFPHEVLLTSSPFVDPTNPANFFDDPTDPSKIFNPNQFTFEAL